MKVKFHSQVPFFPIKSAKNLVFTTKIALPIMQVWKNDVIFRGIGMIFPHAIFKKACKYKEIWTCYNANYIKGAVILPDEIHVSNLQKHVLCISLNPRSQKNQPL